MPQRLKVLIVDDDPVSLIVSQEALTALGHEVLTHDKALGTAPLVTRERPDVVLIDIHMPVLAGNEIVRLVGELQARGKGARTRFILHSGDSEEELARLVSETGALGAIRKTGDATAFQHAFQRLMAVRT
jgi:putative two-component system response regulator